MRDPILLIVIVAGIGLVWLLFKIWRWYRWHSVANMSFSRHWLAYVKRAVPFYDAMPEPLQKELLIEINRFVLFKKFVGCAGLQVTDEMRVTVAASACLLILNRPSLSFRRVNYILLYPAEFIVRRSVKDAAGVVHKTQGHMAGEAWQSGRIILSWDDVKKGIYDFNDGRNVVLHEFAHQLDGESGSMNGAPLLYSKGAYGSWATIMSRDYKSLQEHAFFGRETVLDEYGATNPAEFFAVATESFFEQPEALNKQYPQLYQELQNYFNVDPRPWHKRWREQIKKIQSASNVEEA